MDIQIEGAVSVHARKCLWAVLRVRVSLSWTHSVVPVLCSYEAPDIV
jgi:hypothetical protein